MIISKDIYIIQGNQFVLAYNYFLNKACFISKDLYYKYFIDNSKLDEVKLVFSKNEISYLINNGILIEDINVYSKLSFEKQINNRNTTLKLKTVYLHVTQLCNLRCEYCYNKDNLKYKEKALSTNDLFTIIDKLSDIMIDRIIITGGEPLLRDDIIEIIDYINFKKIKCEILTNGVFLNKLFLHFEKVDSIIVSLDTISQQENQRRGLEIQALITTLKQVPMKYRKKISIRSVISKYNPKGWQAVKKFTEQEGFNFLSSILLPNDNSDIKNMPLIKDIDLENTSLDFSGNICGACYREIAIDSNGDIYPCQSLIIKTYRIANILNNSNWYEMLNQSFITNTFRNATINNIVECSDCKIKYLCGGGCRAIPIKIEGNAFLKAKAICKYQKSIVNSKLKRLLSDFEYKHCHE